MVQYNATQENLARSVMHGTCVTSTKAVSTGWGALFGVWRMRLHTRAALRQLSKEQLADIGITSNMARGEAAKWFWQV